MANSGSATTSAVHVAKIVEEGTAPFWFASLDGETWVECSGDPRGVARSRVQAIMDGTPKGRPLTIAKRWLRQRNAIFLPASVEGR